MENIYRLYLITDTKLLENKDLNKILKSACEGGVTMVQLREKDITTREFLDRAVKTKEILSDYNVPLIINDRIDIALAVDVDGVHLGQTDMPLKIAKKIFPKDKIIGISTNTVEEAVEAERDGADYIGAGPVYNTSTKDNTRSLLGNDKLKKIVESVNIPVVAIGGITVENVKKTIDTGISGIAVASAILNSKHPDIVCKNFLRQYVDF